MTNNRSKKLAFNTILFAISNFGGKLLSFFLVPLYTALLNPEQYGTIDLILTTNSLLMPIVTLSITDAVLRYVMDRSNNTSMVFSTGFLVITIGSVFSFVIIPISSGALGLSDFWLYMALTFVFNAFYSISVQFCRGIAKNILFAVAGVLQIAVLLISNIITLVLFSMGIKGYLISLVLSYAIPFVVVFFAGRLYHYLRGPVSAPMFRSMLKYALPLIPNTILWWVMNASDKFFISSIIGKSENGIYAVANKLPTIINTLSVVFYQAWQLTAIEEVDASDRNEYYSSVFAKLSSVIFLGVGALVLFLKPIFVVWVDPQYFDAWKYTTPLLLAVSFMCFASFHGSILMALNKTGSILKSAFLGAMMNLILNAVFIPKYGLYGAAVSTFVSFFVTWIIRYIDVKKISQAKNNVRLNFNIILSLLLIFSEAGLLYIKNGFILQVVVFVALLFFNRGVLRDLAETLIRVLFRRRG